ncbi:hypothetical protein HU200_037584 [Digitaria exilis]|uniref:Uncharacterized protein n=1 Tax=Digitaria exilis TaxID=1010633 RepID=A0A835EH68_9POAL|nr:hypothetical protein HU200_037584 [Digitaria exilis]CAB3453454.1 unnamed protein product [Digitaria exilis]
MTFVLVDHDDSSTSSEASAGDREDSVVDLLPLFPCGGHYRPATAVTAACALRWLPFAAAVSAIRALLGASHEDLRLRAHQLSRALSGAFFFDRDDAAPPCCPVGGGGARFPEDGLYVCVDLPPLCPALLAVQRALMQVVVKEASHDPCGWYYDTLVEVMRLLVGGDGGGRGPAVFDRVKFESALALEWTE